MAVLTAGQLKELLSNGYDDDATLVVTWWDKNDVVNAWTDIFYDDEVDELSDDELNDIWNKVSIDLDNSLDDFAGGVNEQLLDLVNREA
jgi:hypothetical protein